MIKDSLGNRMKENYECRYNFYLTRRTPVILRIDGCHFHTFTKGFDKPYDKIFIESMQETTKYLCENIMNCKLGYVQSDEISLLLTDFDTHTTESWFNYRENKICSVAASMATMIFNRIFSEKTNNLPQYEKALNQGAYFDCRAFNIPIEEINNYFYWRQLDASRNSIQGLGQKYFSQKELQNKSQSDIQDMLYNTFGINWNDESVVNKRGTCVIRKGNSWIIDTNIPIFKEKVGYISYQWKMPHSIKKYDEVSTKEDLRLLLKNDTKSDNLDIWSKKLIEIMGNPTISDVTCYEQIEAMFLTKNWTLYYLNIGEM